MRLQFHPIFIVYCLSSAIALYMAVLSRNIPSVRGSRTWGVVMACCAIWSIGDGMEILMADLAWKLFFIRVSYIGVIGTAVFWSAFIIIYSNNERLLSRKIIILASIVSITIYIGVLTLHLHPFFYKTVKLVVVDGQANLATTYGPLFKIWAIFAYGAIFGSGVLLVQSVLRFPQYYHGQIYLLILAGLMPLISNFLFITGHNFMAPFDPSAPAFVVSGLLVGFNFRRKRFLDIVPIAHDLVFRHVNSGVIVTDNRGVVLALNPAAEEMTTYSQVDAIGKNARETVFKQFNLDADCFDGEKRTTEVVLNSSVYEVQITPMTDRAHRHSGQIVLLYDITALKQSEKKLSDAYDQLQRVAAEDPLTGLYNRRHFFALAQKVLSIAKRRKMSFSLILVDLDNFKEVNDTLGHPRGDRVLQETAQCLKLFSRDGDILGRYGGDEFIMLAYDADEARAIPLARRFCSNIPPRLAEPQKMEIHVTLSIGIAVCAGGEEISLDTLLERADSALYTSKKGGRNQVAVWRE